jgi:hypothetical protein
VTDLEQKVAEALWRAESIRARGKDRSVPWTEVDERDQAKWLSLARAAIAICAEEMARIAEGETYLERYRTWRFWPTEPDGSKGNLALDCELVKHSDAIAAAIRAMGKGE